MRTRRLGRTTLDVPVLCLGTMTFGWSADEKTSFDVMSDALEHGITFFDTADIYSRWSDKSYAGKTEEIVGRWLREDPSRRGRIVLATKLRGPMSHDPNDQGLSRQHVAHAIEGSLRRLGTDHVDLYQAHWYDDAVTQDETLHALDGLVKDGKVRALGCSNYTAAQLGEALSISRAKSLSRYESLQPHYNLVHREEFERELVALCASDGVGVIPYSPLAGGFLSGKYRRGQPAPAGSRGESSGKIAGYMADARSWQVLDQLDAIATARGTTVAAVALAWVVDAPGVTSAIVGANSVAQLRACLPAADLALTADERRALDQASAWH